jgi:hypothetical protein
MRAIPRSALQSRIGDLDKTEMEELDWSWRPMSPGSVKRSNSVFKQPRRSGLVTVFPRQLHV